MSTKVLVTGARGQVGMELQSSVPGGIELVALDHSLLDITDRARVLERVEQVRPSIIINAAAYTAVDKAEEERDLAYRVNRDAAGHLAEAAHRYGARMIHISTDFVFDGKKSTPYLPEDTPNPLNVYGASKLAGEQLVAERTEGHALIVRTAWVYSAHGKNFVKTMLRLLRERKEVKVVADQVGTPTHAGGLAGTLWKFAARPELHGIYHWTDAGVASWYDFAEAIRSIAISAGPHLSLAAIVPIASAEFHTAAKRPAFSVLEKTSAWSCVGRAEHWGKMLNDKLPLFALR